MRIVLTLRSFRYALHALAATLGVTQLAEKCLGRLCLETKDMVEEAFCRGLSLQRLLENDSESGAEDLQAIPPARNVVHVVFAHVLKDPKPPKRLVGLVINTLADHLDSDLWLKLAPQISHAISIQIISTILIRRQVKSEDAKSLRIKSESVSTCGELTLFAPVKQTATGS